MKMSRMEKKFVNRRKREEKNIKLVEHLFAKSGVDLDHANRALDIGCGVGYVARYLNDRYKMEVTGVDVDPEQIECASEYGKEKDGLHFAVGEATQLPVEDKHFDLVLSFMVIHHIYDWKQVLREVERVLNPNGLYILCEITYPELAVRALRPRTKNYGIFTEDDITGYLEESGFKVVYRKNKRQLAFKMLELVAEKEGSHL